MRLHMRFLLLFAILGISAPFAFSQNKKALTVTDMMKFRQIESPAISNDGKWVLHVAKPGRGDAEVLVYSVDGKKKYTIERGSGPQFSNNGQWVACFRTIPASELLKQEKEPKPKQSLVLLNTWSGEQKVMERVQSFDFSNDSKWLVYQNFKEETNGKQKPGEEDFLIGMEEEKKPGKKKKTGTVLNVLFLQDQTHVSYDFVKRFTIDSTSQYLAFVVADTAGIGNGVFVRDLFSGNTGPVSLATQQDMDAVSLNWNNRTGQLAFLAGAMNEKEELREPDLYLWTPGNGSAEVVLTKAELQEGWLIYNKNHLNWSKDGQRLFLGIKPQSEVIPEEEKNDSIPDLFDVEAILSDREVDVWHWNDPLINPQQKRAWSRIRDRIYTGVFYPGSGTFVPLADESMPDIQISQNASLVPGSSMLPYMKELTWYGRIRDHYLVDLKTGEREKVLTGYDGTPHLSPDGKKLVFYRNKQWYLMDVASSGETNLTGKLEVPFYNEDHDYPSPVPGYGIAGWVEGSVSVWIYDKYDIWQFPTDGGNPECLTGGLGRTERLIFRMRELDQEKQSYQIGERVFLSAYHDLKKYTAVYSMNAGKAGVSKVIDGPRKYTLLSKAENTDKFLFTRQTYTEFPDLWVTDAEFRKTVKITNVNPQVEDFAWGEAGLVEWNNMDGVPMQGVLIRPGNYEPGKKYPVLVYYYRFFSQRLYEFNEVVVNHRPCFPFYASNGYAIFLPDIRFDIGHPGYAATKSLVPGMQKIIDMGIADPDAIGLHGHSWSGYQTAFVITQTNLFACAIAGAPVSNMTSAYSGIRWQSGMARQFQYEQSQSRIGGSLWEFPERYIENSPVFFADRIETPLLIMFGDEDGAVPWYQGIELYLAMRRLEKDCVFLQYRGEPHHLQKYPNKVDYTLKMKEYLDHYLKGEPAPDWIRKGVLYKGK